MRSLRSRLTLTHTLVALAAVLIVVALVSLFVQNGFSRLAVRQATLEARGIAEQLGEYYQRRDGWGPVETLLRRRYPTIRVGDASAGRRVQLLGADGAVLFDNGGPAMRRLQPMRSLASAPVLVGERSVGTVLVGQAPNDLNPPERELRSVIWLSLVIGGLAAAVVALIAGRISAARVARPLRSLTDAAHRLASGQRHEPLALPADRELAELAATFNGMAAELEHQQHLRRQQVADIAHELRTPLSVLRLQLESLEDGVEQPTAQMLSSLSEEARLLARLIEDLRLLSLADAGQLSLSVGAVDAGAAIEQIVAGLSARARQQAISLRADTPQALLVAADPQRLAQVLLNLVENALRYTPAGGVVDIRASALASMPGAVPAGGAVLFAVSDSGPGIAPEDLGRLFGRFWRSDRARARETGGSGLGLAIVQRLVEMQHGRVWAESVVGQGTTLYVALPAACE
jgi:signal transduction histidine kinase